MCIRDSCSIPPQTAQIICKTRPDPIWFWLTVSVLGQTDLVQKLAGVQESGGLLCANASKLVHVRCEADPVCLLGHQNSHENTTVITDHHSFIVLRPLFPVIIQGFHCTTVYHLLLYWYMYTVYVMCAAYNYIRHIIWEDKNTHM